MQNVLISALEQENRTLIDRVIKLEAKIQQNETLYLKSQTSAALISHDKTLDDQAKIRALQDSVHQLKDELARVTMEHAGQQTKCAGVEKALQLSERTKNNLISEAARLKRIVTQYQANEELLVKALVNCLDTLPNIQHEHVNEGRLIPALPLYTDEDGTFPCLDLLNKTLYTIVALLNVNKDTATKTEQNSHEYQALYIENERLKAEVITTRAQLETEKAERKSLLEDAKESFNQLKSLQTAQLEIRTNKIRELEDKISLLEGALKRKQEKIDELISLSRAAGPTHEQLEMIREKKKEEIRKEQQDLFTSFAEATLSELAVDINREKAVNVGDNIRGLRRVSFDSRVLYSSPISPAFNSISKASARVPISKNEIDSSIMNMATGRRLSVIEAADTVRNLTE